MPVCSQCVCVCVCGKVVVKAVCCQRGRFVEHLLLTHPAVHRQGEWEGRERDRETERERERETGERGRGERETGERETAERESERAREREREREGKITVIIHNLACATHIPTHTWVSVTCS